MTGKTLSLHLEHSIDQCIAHDFVAVDEQNVVMTAQVLRGLSLRREVIERPALDTAAIDAGDLQRGVAAARIEHDDLVGNTVNRRQHLGQHAAAIPGQHIGR